MSVGATSQLHQMILIHCRTIPRRQRKNPSRGDQRHDQRSDDLAVKCAKYELRSCGRVGERPTKNWFVGRAAHQKLVIILKSLASTGNSLIFVQKTVLSWYKYQYIAGILSL